MRVRVYSLDTSDVEDHPLRLEAPDPAFILTTISHFLFTTDGRAWLSSGVWISGTSELVDGVLRAVELSARAGFYELRPGPDAWLLRRESSVLLGKPSEVGMFDECARSPDDNWLAWRHYASDGKGSRQLIISRPDGSEMRAVYEGDGWSNPEWLPDSRHISFVGNGDLYTLALDTLKAKQPVASANAQKPRWQPLARGPFLTALPLPQTAE